MEPLVSGKGSFQSSAFGTSYEGECHPVEAAAQSLRARGPRSLGSEDWLGCGSKVSSLISLRIVMLRDFFLVGGIFTAPCCTSVSPRCSSVCFGPSFLWGKACPSVEGAYLATPCWVSRWSLGTGLLLSWGPQKEVFFPGSSASPSTAREVSCLGLGVPV